MRRRHEMRSRQTTRDFFFDIVLSLWFLFPAMDLLRTVEKGTRIWLTIPLNSL